MSAEIYDALNKELQQVIGKYREVARVEQKLGAQKDVGYATLMLNHAWTRDAVEVDSFERIFGEICRL